MGNRYKFVLSLTLLPPFPEVTRNIQESQIVSAALCALKLRVRFLRLLFCFILVFL